MGKDFYKDNIPEVVVPLANKTFFKTENDWKVPTHEIIEDNNPDICYKGKDGRDYPTTEALEKANKMYWDSMMIDTSYKRAVVPEELEKAYFDSVTAAFNVNDINLDEMLTGDRRERISAYLQTRYSIYLDKLLEQLGYGNQDIKGGPKR